MNASRITKWVVQLIVVVTGLKAVSFTAAQDGTPAPDEQSEAHRETLFRFVDEGIVPGNFDLMIELLPEDYVVHSPLGDLDREGVVAFFSALRASMSDFSAVRHQVIVEGNLAAGRHTISGTFDAAEFPSPLGVLQPNGQPVELNVINMWHFNDEGRIVEEWVQFDVLGFFTQMGAFPPPRAGLD